MPYKLICFFFLLGLAPASAQVVTVSEPLSIRNDYAYDLLGMLGGKFLLFRDKQTEFEVQAFDDNMQVAWNKLIDLDKRRPQILSAMGHREYFSVLYTFRRENNLLLKLHRYTPAANLLDSLLLLDYGEQLYPLPLTVVKSDDRTKLLVYSIAQNKEITAASIDLTRPALLWQTTLAPEDFQAGRDLHQVLVDNSGNMLVVLSKDNRKTRDMSHHFQVYEFGHATGMTVRRFDLPMQGRLTFDAFFAFDNLNQRLVAGGLYTDDGQVWARGHYFMSVPIDNPEDITLVFEEFDETFALTVMGKNYNAKNKGINESVIREVVLRRDGGILLIGERERIYERHLSGGRPTVDGFGARFVTDYFLDDMFILAVHPDGKTHWRTVLHKKQYSQDDDAIFSSFALLKSASSLRLMYNDEIRQENTVSEYVVQADGDYDRNSVLSTQNQQLRLRLRDALQVGSSEVIIPSERRSRLQLVKVAF